MFEGCGLCDGYTSWPAGEWAIEPKVDGYRLSIVIDSEGNCEYYCRKPTQVGWAENVRHVGEELVRLGFRGCMVDGELMAESWNVLSSLIRRKRSDMDEETKQRIVDEVKFWVFDVVGGERGFYRFPRARKETRAYPVEYHVRRDLLAMWIKSTTIVRMVPSWRVYSEAEAMERYRELIDLGFEGAVLKDINAWYFFDRTNVWLKLKPFKTVEVTVVEAVEGGGRHVGRLGALTCMMAGGHLISVGGGFSDAEREKFWAHRSALAGLVIEVTMQDCETAVGRHCNFVRVRTELDCNQGWC